MLRNKQNASVFYRWLGLCKQCRHQCAQKLGGETGCGPNPGQRRPSLPCGCGRDDQHHCQQIRSPARAALCHSEWESSLSGERFAMRRSFKLHTVQEIPPKLHNSSRESSRELQVKPLEHFNLGQRLLHTLFLLQ